jgi:hypothetical protein
MGLLGLEAMVVMVVVPGMLGGVLALEREKDTLAALMLTRLSRWQIVFAKLLGRLPQALGPVLVGTPLVVLTAWVAGLPPLATALILAACFSTTCTVAAVSMLASAREPTAAKGLSSAKGFVALWFFLPPMGARLPVGLISASWQTIAGVVQQACALVAPSSPLHVGMAFLAPAYDVLIGRLALLIALQAVIAALALYGAIATLDVRESGTATARAWDPRGGHRPACGDDPIFWREYDLPRRTGWTTKRLAWLRVLVGNLRQLVLLVRFLFLVLFRIIWVALSVGLWLGLLVLVCYLAYQAFAELWMYGFLPRDRIQFQHRVYFNILVRVISIGFGLATAASVVTATASRITQERDRKTWPFLLTTPLTGAEILKAKMRATLLPFQSAAGAIAPLWVLGMVCGAVHLPGMAILVIDVTLLAWASAVIGLRVALRNPSTNAVGTSVTLVGLGLLIVHIPLMLAATSSVDEMRDFLDWSPAFQMALGLYLVALPAVTGILARRVNGEIFDRFDEWVDRPYRPEVLGSPHGPHPTRLQQAAARSG